MEIVDKRWPRALEALRDVGTKPYLRFRVREPGGTLATVTIDLAAA
jgi:hypothetical protein